MSLKDFLGADANLHAREELFNHRLLYDLKLSAAAHGYHLLTYSSGVDHDGFDIIFDDREVLRKIQLKTIADGVTTSSWGIHRHILRPRPEYMQGYGFASSQPYGVEGGVVLIEYKVQADGETLDIGYFYTEFSVIAGILLGLIPRHGATVSAARGIFDDIMKGNPSEKIGVARGLFLPAARAHNLLCLLGLDSKVAKNWQHRIYAVAREEWGEKGLTAPSKLKEYRDSVYAVLKEVCGCDKP
jgi:hypothetical protein